MDRKSLALPSNRSLVYLSHLLLRPQSRDTGIAPQELALGPAPNSIQPNDIDDLLALARLHHVIVRGLDAFLELHRNLQGAAPVQWAEHALAAERVRISKAVYSLHRICHTFHHQGYDATVIKTLDHWPDFGSDLDLFTTASPEDVRRLMEDRFVARIQPRSWGDHLANKWNFLIPGLPEPVEVHVSRLGQTGEQSLIAATLGARARRAMIGGYLFPITSISDRLMIAALQRMYRHFNLRLCDILDTLAIADAGIIDYEHLREVAGAAGIWEGVATYLRVVSDYAATYRGVGIRLPSFVTTAAQFGGDSLYFANGYLRVPIVPQSAQLYKTELAHVLGRGELHNGARLSLLPLLGTAAAAKQKLTGSNEGIW